MSDCNSVATIDLYYLTFYLRVLVTNSPYTLTSGGHKPSDVVILYGRYNLKRTTHYTYTRKVICVTPRQMRDVYVVNRRAV